MGFTIDSIDRRSKLRTLGLTYVLGAAAILFLAFFSTRVALHRVEAILFGSLYGIAAGTIYCIRDIMDATLFGRTALGVFQ
jgi:hypothetical protein